MCFQIIRLPRQGHAHHPLRALDDRPWIGARLLAQAREFTKAGLKDSGHADGMFRLCRDIAV